MTTGEAIRNPAAWKKWQEANAKDPYGKCCVDVARKVMEFLDARPGPFDALKLVCEADDAISAGGITGFMAGAVAQMVSEVHARGEEFRAAWNRAHQIEDEGDKATKKGATLNPALVTVKRKGGRR